MYRLRLLTLAFGLLVLATQMPLMAQHFRVTVPYDNLNGKLVTQVTVNGHTGRFLIDTGAPCCVSYSFAQKIGLKTQSAQTAEDSNGRSVQTHLVTLDSLRLGNVTFDRLQALRWPEGNMTEQFGIDGILGYNLMRMGIVKFDGRRQQFTLTDFTKDLGIAPDCSTPLLPHSYLPLVVIRLGQNVTDTVMFDCGAADFYEMSQRQYARLRHERKAVRHLASGHGTLSMGAAGIEEASLKHRLCIPRLTLGKNAFRNVTTVTTDGSDSRIGSDLLRHGDVIIDYKQALFYFLPYEVKATPDLYQKEWEVVITVMNGQLTAGLVWNDRLPIKSGDRIINVNGRAFDQVRLEEATTQPLIPLHGDKAEITFINSATQQPQTITIRRK